MIGGHLFCQNQEFWVLTDLADAYNLLSNNGSKVTRPKVGIVNV